MSKISQQASRFSGCHKGRPVISLRFKYGRALIGKIKGSTGARWSRSEKPNMCRTLSHIGQYSVRQANLKNRNQSCRVFPQLTNKGTTYKSVDHRIGTRSKKAFVFMGAPVAGGEEFQKDRPTGIDYWGIVDCLVQEETMEEQNRITLGTLAGIGIEKGKPFKPGSMMEKILSEAETVGKLTMVNEAFSPRHAPDGAEKDLCSGQYSAPTIQGTRIRKIIETPQRIAEKF